MRLFEFQNAVSRIKLLKRSFDNVKKQRDELKMEAKVKEADSLTKVLQDKKISLYDHVIGMVSDNIEESNDNQLDLLFGQVAQIVKDSE